MTPYFLVFLAGLAGSFHCIGMCGGFACAMGAGPHGRGAARHLVYNAGRVATYCFLGGFAGYLGMQIAGAQGAGLGLMQRTLALVSGTLMVFIGLQFWGYFRGMRIPLGQGANGQGAPLANALRALLGSSGMAAPLAFGVFNGLLPCPLVYAFAAQAAASGGPLPGLLTMAAFGLGTFPAMLLMGGLGARLDARKPAVGATPTTHRNRAPALVPPRSAWRQHGVRVAGAFIVLLGVITFARGMFPLAAHG